MKISQLIEKCKNEIPNIKTTGITDAQLAAILSGEACDEVNMLAQVYKGYTDFNIADSQSLYALSTIVPTYLGITKEGLWVKDSNGVLRRVRPKTLEWLNKRIENWRDQSAASECQYYYVEGNDLEIYPSINEDRTNGGRLYHLRKATVNTNVDNYPWNNAANEITALRPMDNSLVYFVRWKLTPALNKSTEGGNSSAVYFSWQDFLKEVRRGAAQVKRRPDLSNDDCYEANFSL